MSKDNSLTQIMELVEAKTLNLVNESYSDLFNKMFGVKISEDEARKRFYGLQMILPVYQDMTVLDFDEDEYQLELEKRKRELLKERQRLSDVRAAYSKDIRDEARWDELVELVKEEVAKIVPYEPVEYTGPVYGDAPDLAIQLNDIHYGIEIDNYWNQYSPEIAKFRLDMYLEKIFDIQNIHGARNAHVFLNGDLVSGLIKWTIQLANRENVVHQVMGVSELISWFVLQLKMKFETVNVYMVAGNHSRLTMSKNDAPKDERLDNLIPWYLEARLQNINGVKICAEKQDDTVGTADIRNRHYGYVHGDLDSLNGILKLIEMFDVEVSGIFMGHKHHNMTDTIQGYKVVMSGSLCGMDDYCVSNRILGRAEQIVTVCDESGIIANYDVVLQ